jgi:hypothetical protein
MQACILKEQTFGSLAADGLRAINGGCGKKLERQSLLVRFPDK